MKKLMLLIIVASTFVALKALRNTVVDTREAGLWDTVKDESKGLTTGVKSALADEITLTRDELLGAFHADMEETRREMRQAIQDTRRQAVAAAVIAAREAAAQAIQSIRNWFSWGRSQKDQLTIPSVDELKKYNGSRIEEIGDFD